MRILEKITLVIYSLIVLVIAVLTSLLVFGVLTPETVEYGARLLVSSQTVSLSVLAIDVIFILLSIKCIFFRKSNKKEKAQDQGILLQNENGKLIISKETIENLVNTIIKQFETVEGVATSITLNSENNLIINLNLTVGENVIIKELSANVQEKIKTAVRTTFDLEVKEVNIKIKNYSTKKESVSQQ